MTDFTELFKSKRLVTQQEAAEYLGIKVSTLESWRWSQRRRPLPFVKVGRLIRYRPEDLDAFIHANRTSEDGGQSHEGVN
jgi:excisionase family DNA binding protein